MSNNSEIHKASKPETTWKDQQRGNALGEAKHLPQTWEIKKAKVQESRMKKEAFCQSQVSTTQTGNDHNDSLLKGHQKKKLINKNQ